MTQNIFLSGLMHLITHVGKLILKLKKIKLQKPLEFLYVSQVMYRVS